MMEKQTENRIHSLEEFIQTRGLSDWPVACEDLDESSSHLLRQAADTHTHLRAGVCVPSAESLRSDLQTLLMKIRLYGSAFTHEVPPSSE